MIRKKMKDALALCFQVHYSEKPRKVQRTCPYLRTSKLINIFLTNLRRYKHFLNINWLTTPSSLQQIVTKRTIQRVGAAA